MACCCLLTLDFDSRVFLMTSIKDEKSLKHFFTPQCSSTKLRFPKKPERTENFPNSTPNLKACVGGVVFHLPLVMIHNIKSTDLGSSHIEGFQDWCMYSRNNHMLEIATWDEKPCIF